MTTVTTRTRTLSHPEFRLRTGPVNHRCGAVLCGATGGGSRPMAAVRAYTATQPLNPVAIEAPGTTTWERIGNLVRIGLYAIGVAGLVKVTGALVQGVTFVMLLLHYLLR